MEARHLHNFLLFYTDGETNDDINDSLINLMASSKEEEIVSSAFQYEIDKLNSGNVPSEAGVINERELEGMSSFFKSILANPFSTGKEIIKTVDGSTHDGDKQHCSPNVLEIPTLFGRVPNHKQDGHRSRLQWPFCL